MLDLIAGFGAYGAAASGPTLLLDTGIASPVNAWSLRKLRSAYSGSAIRIRRSSDSTEQDIGFSGEDLDTAAISSFVSSNSAFIVTIYDQQGSDNLTMATASRQPRIVNAGTLDTKNSKAVIHWDGSDKGLRKAGVTTLAGISQFTTSAVASMVNAGGANRRILSFMGSASSDDFTNATSAIPLNRFGANQAVSSYRQGAERSNSSITYAQMFTMLSRYDASNNIVTVDGTDAASSAYSATALDATSQTMTMGGDYQTPIFSTWNGQIGEVIVWASALGSTDRSTLQSNQKTFWGTP